MTLSEKTVENHLTRALAMIAERLAASTASADQPRDSRPGVDDVKHRGND
jgi:hypothetical protein